MNMVMNSGTVPVLNSSLAGSNYSKVINCNFRMAEEKSLHTSFESWVSSVVTPLSS